MGPLVEMNKFCPGGDQIGVQENQQISQQQTAVFVSGIRFLPSIWFFSFLLVVYFLYFIVQQLEAERDNMKIIMKFKLVIYITDVKDPKCNMYSFYYQD